MKLHQQKPHAPALNVCFSVLCPAQRQRLRLRLLLRSISPRTGVLSQDTETGARGDLPPLGHESVALEKLLSLPEIQQLEEAEDGLLWDREVDQGAALRRKSERRGVPVETRGPASAPPTLAFPLAPQR